jgi:hypothetical protein
MAVIWVVEPYGLVEVNQFFRGTCCLHHQGRKEAARTSEVSVNFYESTWCYNSEDCNLHTCCCDNLKSHLTF